MDKKFKKEEKKGAPNWDLMGSIPFVEILNGPEWPKTGSELDSLNPESA